MFGCANRFGRLCVYSLPNHLLRMRVVTGSLLARLLQDTAGQERFHALGPIYYRDADGAACARSCHVVAVGLTRCVRVYSWDAGERVDSGALLVYDITDVDSFARVKNWVKELRKIVGDDISICIAGNKKDLQKNAHVSMEEADAYAASVGAQHIRTSAKLNQGVNEVFLALVQSAFSRVLRSSFSLCGV